MEKIDKTLKRVKNTLDFIANKLSFNEVHVSSYKNNQGKTRYKGNLRVKDRRFVFKDMTLNDMDNLTSGILIGYLFCMVKNEYKK